MATFVDERSRIIGLSIAASGSVHRFSVHAESHASGFPASPSPKMGRVTSILDRLC